jgi:RNA 2',3'-cyclic 3'-phosphodiesterase
VRLEAKSLRLFVALALPEAVRAKLIELQRKLKRVLPGNSMGWTKPESLHLTLRFLGNVESTRIPELSGKLVTALAGFGEFDLVCERLGCFPDLRHPRVVWAWVHDSEARLAQLHRRVDEAVNGFAGQPAEERFVGHITLARPRQIQRRDAERLSKFIEDAVTCQFGDWRVSSVSLIHSQLLPAGASYAEVCRASLR